MTEIVRCALKREARFLAIATALGSVGVVLLGLLV